VSSVLAALLVAANLWPVVPDTLCRRAEWFLLNRHLDAGYMDSCGALLRVARSRGPGDARSLVLQARYCVQRGEDAGTKDDKLKWFLRARAVADTLRCADGTNADGHLWWATAQGSILRLQGPLAAALGAGEVRRGLERAVALNPQSALAWYAVGCLYDRLPGLAGGSLKKTEGCLRRGVAADSNYTIIRLGLAQLLVRQRRYGEARAEAESVLATENPTHPAEFVLNDRPAALALLESLKAQGR
jgi:hypothetical protein